MAAVFLQGADAVLLAETLDADCDVAHWVDLMEYAA